MNNENQLVKWIKSNLLRIIIFDFDGTLLDIRDVLKNSILEVFEEFEIETDINLALKEIGSVLESIQGYPIPKIILQTHKIFKFIRSLEHIDFLRKLEIATKIYTKYLEYEKSAPLFSGVKPLLEKLSKKFDLYIISHSQTKNLIRHLQEKSINKYFKGIFGVDKLPSLKPDPTAFEPVFNQYRRIDRNEFLIIGDMPTDIEAGQEAGIWTIGIASGISNKDLLFDCQPDLIIESIYELYDIFGLEKKKDINNR
ncbi:MAG: HAD family hydrolase [Candidatus Lokiarchaeota archaeon]|nr:HAD family hydrolase [Candidatus Lokiarchaeota archaeon]